MTIVKAVLHVKAILLQLSIDMQIGIILCFSDDEPAAMTALQELVVQPAAGLRGRPDLVHQTLDFNHLFEL